ncbi:DDHD domain-containing protein [Dipodascopsis uninucleata]
MTSAESNNINKRRLPFKNAPVDTPPLIVRWYFATDIPKTKPFTDKNWKPPKSPSKFMPFSVTDSRNIEIEYQKDQAECNTVAVNEDHLFQVDIRKRELAPIYWSGPTYEIRRGSWFYADSTLKPCDENLANQIEEGYIKRQPYKKVHISSSTNSPVDKASTDATSVARSASACAITPTEASPAPSQTCSHVISDMLTVEADESISHKRTSSFTDSIASAFTFTTRSPSKSNPPLPVKDIYPNTETPKKDAALSGSSSPVTSAGSAQVDTWPLYGPHMGKYVVYSNDGQTAWIISDDFYSKFASSVYQRITAGANMGGIKLNRGWYDVKATANKSASATKQQKDAQDQSAAETDITGSTEDHQKIPTDPATELADVLNSSTASNVTNDQETAERQEAAANALLEEQMAKDYNPDEGEDPTREIEHLVLCVHGIGQKLGQRLESVNFVGDVNLFRKTLKSVYSTSPDLQTLNGEKDLESKKINSRIQVLPVCWRHSIHFGLKSDNDETIMSRQGSEKDIGDVKEYADKDKEDDDDAATLQDITVDGIPALRGIISEVLLDILLYYQPNYRERIMNNVIAECNRIYHLFKKNNPSFNGRVSIAGHSLGAAISFDILCRQPDLHDFGSSLPKKNVLDFDVDSFFGLGSPVGLFQMLKGKAIMPRTVKSVNDEPLSPLNYDIDTPFDIMTQKFATISTPNVEDIYNIFHPADPISYRMEPLVVKRMAELKPQPIPSTRRGLNTQIANIAELTQRVAQSASNMWSSVASGLASSILNKSLGYEAERPTSSSQNATDHNGSNIDSSVSQQDLKTPVGKEHEKIETLYSKFQQDNGKLAKTADYHAKLQRDEELIRGLNYTGRLDFALQEGYMDITLLASLSSHLGYFRDPDVANFIIGQLIARPYPKRMKSISGRNKNPFQSLDALS